MSNLLILLSFIISLVAVSADEPSMVIEFFRHGARSPSKAIDKTWKTKDELTFVGMRQHYILGKLIAERYPHLVDSYHPKHLYVRSTDFNRTLQSAQSQLRGIFEKKASPVLPKNPDLSLINPPWDNQTSLNSIEEELKELKTALPGNATVIPVHTVPQDKDTLLYLNSINCPNSASWFQERPKDKNAMKVFNSLGDTTTYLNEQGYNLKLPMDYFLLGDTVAANFFENKALPKGIDAYSAAYNDTIFVYQWFVSYVYAGGTGDEMKAVDFAIKNKILDLIQKKVNSETELKLVMLSGHDTTLLGVLAMFDIVTPDCLIENHEDVKAGKPVRNPRCKFPTYASSIFFEFYDAADGNEPYVKFVYNSETLDICGTGGDGRCPLPKFNEVVKKKINIDDKGFESLCHDKKKEPEGEWWIKVIQWILLGFLILLGTGLIVGIVYILVKGKKQKQQTGANNENYQRINESGDPEINLSHD